jgi:hypothetical protein
VEHVVVAGVDDHQDLIGRHDLHETTQEPGGTDSTRKHGKHGGSVRVGPPCPTIDPEATQHVSLTGGG